MYRLTVRHHFDAAHFLRNYRGKCAQLHGHRWLVEVSVEGKALDETGMLVDFSYIKQNLKTKLAELDHGLINDFAYFQSINPTAENLAKYLFAELSHLLAGANLEKVRVYETPDAWAEYWEE